MSQGQAYQTQSWLQTGNSAGPRWTCFQPVPTGPARGHTHLCPVSGPQSSVPILVLKQPCNLAPSCCSTGVLGEVLPTQGSSGRTLRSLVGATPILSPGSRPTVDPEVA